MHDHILWLYAASGAAVGALVGLTGVGGGSLMTPILILLFGFAPVTAVGTDQLFASVTKAFGSTVHGYNRTVDWKIVGRLAAGSVPGAALMLALLWYLRISGGAANALVSKALSIALVLSAASLVLRPWLVRISRGRVSTADPARVARLTVLTGVVLGVLVSLTSVGAGALGVVALVLLYPDVPIGRIVGSDVAHAVPLTLVAGLGHWFQGSVDVKLLTTLLLGSIPGILIGSLVVPRIPEFALRVALASVLLFVSARFLIQ